MQHYLASDVESGHELKAPSEGWVVITHTSPWLTFFNRRSVLDFIFKANNLKTA